MLPVPALYPAELSTEYTLELLSWEGGSWVGSRFPASEEEGGQEPSLEEVWGWWEARLCMNLGSKPSIYGCVIYQMMILKTQSQR